MTAETISKDVETFVAFAAYVPVHADELALAIGDMVELMHSYDDGWILGKNTRTSAVGLAPCNFLQSVAPAAKINGTAAPGSTPMILPTGAKALPKAAAPNRTASLVLRSRRTSHASPFEQMVDKLNKDLPPPGVAPGAAAPKIVNGTSGGPHLPPQHMAPQPSGQQQPPIPVTPFVKAVSFAHVKKKMVEMQSSRATRAPAAEDVGRLRILFAGDSGIGKTSLIRHFLKIAEVQSADPVIEDLPAVEPTAFAIEEYHASTTDPSAPDHNHNLTFIDTPGFGNVMDAHEVMRPIINHMQKQFAQSNTIFTPAASPTQLSRFLATSSGAHSHVDVVVYCILHRLTPVDLEYLKRLDRVVAVVPVIVCSDTLTFSRVKELKKQVVDTLLKHGIDVYRFGLSREEFAVAAENGVGHPFAVTTVSPRSVVSQVRRDSDIPASEAPLDRPVVNEFEELKDALLFTHVHDLRRVTADRFVRWRSAGARAE
ncbi:hypothetical protein HKX48_004295 [Thoreauomyces humboldtii]|nr:hypothetical protein HKX48_004295 [Thoreauomyces humboldtii]